MHAHLSTCHNVVRYLPTFFFAFYSSSIDCVALLVARIRRWTSQQGTTTFVRSNSSVCHFLWTLTTVLLVGPLSNDPENRNNYFDERGR